MIIENTVQVGRELVATLIAEALEVELMANDDVPLSVARQLAVSHPICVVRGRVAGAAELWLNATGRALIVLLDPKDRRRMPSLLGLGVADVVVMTGDWRLELSMRLRGRAAAIAKFSATPRRIGSATLDLERAVLSSDTRQIDLTPVQARILTCLVDAPTALVTPSELARLVLPRGDQPSTLKTHIARLRRRIGADIGIVTVRGHGYGLAERLRTREGVD